MTDEINKRFNEIMDEAEQVALELRPIFENKTISAITMGVALSFEALAELNGIQKESFYVNLLGARKLIHYNRLLKQGDLMSLVDNFQDNKHILK